MNSARIEAAIASGPLDDDTAMALAAYTDTARLMEAAAAVRDAAHGDRITYSPKVFIPLTHLCRDVCHYCTFAKAPRHGPAYMRVDEVLEVASAGAGAGCHEALFTLGDKPELRYKRAREALERLGYASTLDYLVAAAGAVLTQTGLLPHVNPGVLDREGLRALRRVSASAGLMLESTAARLGERGGAHFGSPDKCPEVRLETLELAGEEAVPFTTGVLIGIGETRAERLEALLQIRAAHRRHGHVQEVIVQNFRAKPGTAMAAAPEPSAEELRWTVAVARLVLDPDIHLQVPPNLNPEALAGLIAAGIDDWGGVSPVTPDHVNPEAPWPALERLRAVTEAAGKQLAPRLPIYPEFAAAPERWLDPALRASVLRRADAQALARDSLWVTGSADAQAPALPPVIPGAAPRDPLAAVLARASAGDGLEHDDVVQLFSARGSALQAVVAAADGLRATLGLDTVTYAVNRNINYTNVCTYHCRFCAFSKGRTDEDLRGKPYDLDLAEVVRRAEEAWQRGATEVCLQGGIHPHYTGQTYLDICHAIHAAVPDLHIHAFSPLEVRQGARTLGLPIGDFLARLRDAGLSTLPGTAAEILDDEVRRILCPDKLNTEEWLEVMETAHGLGLRTTATIMFGHVDSPTHWARHLMHVAALQRRTGGFTEFVPLPFVAFEAPLYRRGQARSGPTYREAVLMHAVARLAFGKHLTNIQTSWVKMGPDGALACLQAGANDLGGTLMNESITRAAGASHGQELDPARMRALALRAGRPAMQRTTVYGRAPASRVAAADAAPALAPVVNTPVVSLTRARAS